MTDEHEQAKREALVQFGAELQRLRQMADISQRELAKHTLVSHQMVGAIERAERAPRKDFTAKADSLLNAHGELLQLWPGGRQSHPHWFKEFLELEAEARSIQSFEAQTVPGLLQTKAYAHAVLAASWPPNSETEMEHLLSARLARQETLTRDAPPAPLVSVIIDESALRRPVGGTAAMVEQLDHLTVAARRPNIQLQILAFAQGEHAAMDGSFVVFDMSKGTSVVYIEGPGSGQVITNAPEVEECGQRFGALRSLALSPAGSLDLIARYKEEYHHGADPDQVA